MKVNFINTRIMIFFYYF